MEGRRLSLPWWTVTHRIEMVYPPAVLTGLYVEQLQDVIETNGKD